MTIIGQRRGFWNMSELELGRPGSYDHVIMKIAQRTELVETSAVIKSFSWQLLYISLQILNFILHLQSP